MSCDSRGFKCGWVEVCPMAPVASGSPVWRKQQSSSVSKLWPPNVNQKQQIPKMAKAGFKFPPQAPSVLKEIDVGDGSWWNIYKTYEGGLLGNVPQN